MGVTLTFELGPYVYQYAVQACNWVGCGLMSKWSTILYVPDSPKNVRITEFTYDGGSQIYARLSWDPVVLAVSYTYSIS